MNRSARKKTESAPDTQRIVVAVAQAAPVVFNRKRTLEKVHALARDAARAGAIGVVPGGVCLRLSRGAWTSARWWVRGRQRAGRLPPILGEQRGRARSRRR